MKKTGTINFLSFKNRFSPLIGDDSINWKEILTGVLTTHFKASQATIDELTADGVKPEFVRDKLNEMDKERVKSLSTLTEAEKTKSFQEGFKKAKKEVLTESETAKKEAHGIKSDLTGIELDNFIIAEKLKEAGAKSEDEIRKTPTYQALETKYKNDLKAANEATEAKVKELETGYKKEQTFTIIGKKAIDIITGLKVVLPTNAAVAETHKNDFLTELKGYEYEESADGKILVSKGGELLKDAHGHTLSYDDHVKAIAAKRFEFAANNGGQNSGSNPANSGTNPATYPAGIEKPKDLASLTATLAKLTTPADKRIVLETFQKDNPGK